MRTTSGKILLNLICHSPVFLKHNIEYLAKSQHGWEEHIVMLCAHSSPTLGSCAFKGGAGRDFVFVVLFDLAHYYAWYPQQTWLSLVVLCKLLQLA